MLIRLIFRAGQSDADGRCVGFDYYTEIVEVPDHLQNLEVIGGEWIQPPQPAKEEALKED